MYYTISKHSSKNFYSSQNSYQNSECSTLIYCCMYIVHCWFYTYHITTTDKDIVNKPMFLAKNASNVFGLLQIIFIFSALAVYLAIPISGCSGRITAITGVDSVTFYFCCARETAVTTKSRDPSLDEGEMARGDLECSPPCQYFIGENMNIIVNLRSEYFRIYFL